MHNLALEVVLVIGNSFSALEKMTYFKIFARKITLNLLIFFLSLEGISLHLVLFFIFYYVVVFFWHL